MSDFVCDVRFKRDRFTLDVDLSVPSRGVTSILGASGSGKSTLLRLIAGLERPAAGRIALDGAVWFDSHDKRFTAPSQRCIGMLFQDYALFEHKTVAENVGYGVPKRDRATVVPFWLDQMKLSEFADRLPRNLSGGQRQRIGLARALAVDPALMLLDEPFSAIDTHLRQSLREQMFGLVESLRKPTLMVTHDLEEARLLSDHIGIMSQGALIRLGSTNDVLSDPGTVEAAKIVGWSNILPIRSIRRNLVAADWGQMSLDRSVPLDASAIGIRPEHIRIVGHGDISAKIGRVTELGAIREVHCRMPGGETLTLHRPWDEPIAAPGSDVQLLLPRQHVRLLGSSVCLSQSSQIQRHYCR